MSACNAAAYLELAVESILSQSLENFEFLIVDDGSTDETGSILAMFAQRDRRIRILRQPNRGLIASLNRLIAEARSPFIARMDADDVALPGRLQRQLAFLSTHADVGVLGTGTLDLGPANELLAEPPACATDHATLVGEIEHRTPFCHPSVMMRTGVARDAGGYRAAFRHCEDYDLWLRLATRTRFANLPDRLLAYRRSASQVSHRYALAQHYGSAVAWLCHRQRASGAPDPLAGRDALPALDQLDAMFGPGTTRAVRSKVALGILYSPAALRGDGLRLILEHLRSNGSTEGLWRTVARLVTLGEARAAARLAGALAWRWARAARALRSPAVGHGLPNAHLYRASDIIKELGK